MATLTTLRARNRQAWRHWLENHHATSRGLWLQFYKKHTGKPSVTYAEALDEALCFGWIDSIVKFVDEESYVRKFTPRTNPKQWSAVNLRHMRRLIAAGRMTPAGLRVLGGALDAAPDRARKPPAAARTLEAPESLLAAISQEEKAEAFWQKLAPGCRRRYTAWVLDAKRADTRSRRVAEVVRYLAEGKKSVLK
jgi:uncharacterized protein YdeI (YjbR/CyaY-like superfamily)